MIKPFFLLFVLALFARPLAALENGAELFAAAAAGQVERVDALLLQGADVNAKNATGRTALLIAAAAGNARIVRKLLAYGADPNAADPRGITPLMEAATHGYEEAVKALIAAGADPNAKDGAGVLLLDRIRKTAPPHIITLLENYGAKGSATIAGEDKKSEEDKTGDQPPAENDATKEGDPPNP